MKQVTFSSFSSCKSNNYKQVYQQNAQRLNIKVTQEVFNKVGLKQRILVQNKKYRQKSLQVLSSQNPQQNGSTNNKISDNSVSVVLVAGGTGKRMGAKIPKQYLLLRGQAICNYSLKSFAQQPMVREIVVVCDPNYKFIFEEQIPNLGRDIPIKFALPGKERYDSVYSGFKAADQSVSLIAIHDSARPVLKPSDFIKCIEDAQHYGAAVLGVQVKPTIKEVDQQGLVRKTLERKHLWEVQTPQIIKPDLLQRGFDKFFSENVEVTDDVSLIEALGLPVKITQGSYSNLKITTPDDIMVAEKFIDEELQPQLQQPLN